MALPCGVFSKKVNNHKMEDIIPEGNFGFFKTGVPILDRYKKINLIGETKQCNVFLVENGTGGDRKAIKVTNLVNLKRGAISKVANEIRLQKELRNDNIVKSYGGCIIDKIAYMIMEYCDGLSLDKILKRRKIITDPEANIFISQIINGLMYLKENLVIHRDIKLANIFLDNGKAKIGDFGYIAKLDSPDQRRKTMCGTPNYIAPEILKRERYSFEVDIWSTGVCLYIMLHGIPPFAASTPNDTFKKIKRGDLKFSNLVNRPSKELILRMLDQDPTKRITVDEMYSVL